MSAIGKAYVVTLCCWLGLQLMKVQNLVKEEIGQPFVPMFVIGIIAYFVATLFLNIFEYAALAIMHCFIMDEDNGAGHQAPDSLKPFLELDD